MAYSNKMAYRKWYEKNRDSVREYKKLVMRKLRSKNPEHYREQSRQAKYRLKEKVFNLYGRKCVICGFEDIRALTLDHVNNNGAEERKIIGERGVYRRALNEKYKSEYQILCMNCQFIKRVEAKRQNQHGKYSGSG